jgi:cytochrome b6-f complex iron-sulfur subunit
VTIDHSPYGRKLSYLREILDVIVTIYKFRRCIMTQFSGTSDVPDLGRRQFMNLLTFGTITGIAAGALYPIVKYFIPPSSGSGGGGVTAKDALGNDVIVSQFLSTHNAGDRTLAQGLKGDPTYMVITGEKTIESYGINAICTHLGCVVPWNANENKFMCPCHGSQYNSEGKVVRGPAPLSLALAHAQVTEDDKLVFSPWTETDFRTNEDPWWA